jgi:hypothetical protein
MSERNKVELDLILSECEKLNVELSKNPHSGDNLYDNKFVAQSRTRIRAAVGVIFRKALVGCGPFLGRSED